MAALKILSSILGWTYVICWMVSFYPQAWQNYKRKSVTGLSIDFVVSGLLGFVCYSIFTCSFYFISSIQEEYRRAHDGHDNLIRINDVFFSLHALLLAIVYLIQVILYRKKDENLSIPGALSCGGISMALLILAGLATVNVVSWLNFMYVLSYVKLVLTLVKCAPQVYLNYKLKSTVGWSIQNVMLDFTGGALSITQLFLDAFTAGSPDGIRGISAKLSLGLISIVFDIIFLLQHYVWFRKRPHQTTIIDTDFSKMKDLEAQANVDVKSVSQ